MTKVRVTLPGVIMDKELKDAGPVLGRLENVREEPGEIYFESPSLANHNDAVIALSVWYFGTREGQPSVEIVESGTGPAREVSSTIQEAEFWLSRILRTIFAVFGVVAIMLLAVYGMVVFTQPAGMT